MSHYVLAPDAMNYLAKWTDQSVARPTEDSAEQETATVNTPVSTAAEAKGDGEASVDCDNDLVFPHPARAEAADEGEDEDEDEEEEEDGEEEDLVVVRSHKSRTAQDLKRKRSGMSTTRKPKRR